MLCAPAVIAAVHVGVGLALLVQDPVLVHTLVSLGVPRSQISRAESPGAGIAPLLADAGVAVVRTDIGITQLVGLPGHVLTLAQHYKENSLSQSLGLDLRGDREVGDILTLLGAYKNSLHSCAWFEETVMATMRRRSIIMLI